MTPIPDLSKLGLTESQKAARKNCLGGSDAKIIMSGDSEKINHLARIKMGIIDDSERQIELSPSLGHWVEPFNIAWFQKETGRTVHSIGEHRIAAAYSFMGCTLDGLTSSIDGRPAVLQAKFSNPFWKIPELVDLYLAQITHEMVVCGTDRGVLSFILGNSKWVPIELEIDEFYASQIIDREKYFWDCVQSRAMPEKINSKIETPAPKMIAMRIVDMEKSNASTEWQECSNAWLEELPFIARRVTTLDKIKSLVMDDVAEAYGFGIKLKRSKNNRITITQDKDDGRTATE